MNLDFLKLKIPPPIILIISSGLVWSFNGLVKMPLLFNFNPRFGFITILTGFMIIFTAAYTFHRVKTTISPLNPEKTSKIVNEGVFSITRNPMYLGMVFILFGLWLFYPTLFGIAIIILFVKYIEIFQIKPEEEILKQKFGEDYEVYANSVRRWF